MRQECVSLELALDGIERFLLEFEWLCKLCSSRVAAPCLSFRGQQQL